MTGLPHFTKGEIGELDYPTLNEVFDICRRIAPLIPGIERSASERAAAIHEYRFDAIITGNILISPNRWRYSWERSIFNDSTRKWVTWKIKADDPNHANEPIQTSFESADAFGLGAYNRYEQDNDGTGVEGMGVDVSAPGFTITMLPIPSGTPVEIRAVKGTFGQVTYHFHAVNAYDITCAEP